MASKDAQVRKVASELDQLVSQLSANVEALAAILTRPATPPENDERLVTP